MSTRRKFLGMLGGAVAAGPRMAKAAVAQMPAGLGIVGPDVNYATDKLSLASSTGSGDWRLDEIARLRRFISGELSDEEKEDRWQAAKYARQAQISNHYAGLQSVAACRKIDMFNRDIQRLHDEIHRRRARGRLANLLQQVVS